MRRMILSVAISSLMLLVTACGSSTKNVEETRNTELFQFQEAEQQTVATIKTNKGDVKIRLFPEKAPKAVENFVTHSENGYYDGLTFHRVINDFMIQGGDPAGDGTGGESIWGEPFEDEISSDLRHFRGALSMANSGENTNGSQFFIVQNSKIDENIKKELEFFIQNQNETIDEEGTIKISDVFPASVCEEYINNGGVPTLDGQHTVFGQVFEGMEVVDSIAAVETDENDKPIEDVIIETIEIVKP